MGLCVSSEAAGKGEAATAKVLLPGGELREYGAGTTVATVLARCAAESLDCFVCDADEIGVWEEFTPATPGYEQLRPGRLYFALPKEMRCRRLSLAEMAALAATAVKAAELRGKEAPLVSAAPEEEREQEVVVRRQTREEEVVVRRPTREEEVVVRRAVRRRRRGRGRGRRRFIPVLAAIPECED